jgi:hypothetical protein
MSCFSEKGRGLDRNSDPGVDLSAGRDTCVSSRAPLGVIFGLRTHGRLEHLVKCILIWLAVTLEPHRQPQGIRRPGGRPRLAFEFFPRRSKLFT